MEAPRRTRKLARKLRKEMSLPEVLLWKAIKGGRLSGLHFRLLKDVDNAVATIRQALEDR